MQAAAGGQGGREPALHLAHAHTEPCSPAGRSNKGISAQRAHRHVNAARCARLAPAEHGRTQRRVRDWTGACVCVALPRCSAVLGCQRQGLCAQTATLMGPPMPVPPRRRADAVHRVTADAAVCAAVNWGRAVWPPARLLPRQPAAPCAGTAQLTPGRSRPPHVLPCHCRLLT